MLNIMIEIPLSIKGKITERWLVEREGIFFLIEGIFSNQERAWLPVNDWLIRCIATVRYLEICYQVFVATMACRFIEADDELIELLKCESENKNTKRSTGYWKGIFEKWAKTRGQEEQLESYDIPELNEEAVSVKTAHWISWEK